MPQNKRHHYVPRFYLKRFTDDERFINLYNLKAEKKITNAKLKNQCYQNYLCGKDRPVEKSLAHIETGASQLFRKIDHYQRPPPPGTEDQYLMLVYLMMQRGRTIHAADTINEMFDKMTKETWGDYFMQKDGIDLNDFEIGIEDSANYALGLSMTMYPLLFDMHYKLLVNKASVEFITSYHPVVMYNQLMRFRNIGSNCGVACKGLQVFFPIDPKKLILLYDGVVYRVGGNQITIEITSPQDVYELNTVQMCSAVDNVYFNDPTINMEALHRKARPYLRTERAVVKASVVAETPAGSEKLVGMSSNDVRTNLQVSQITIRGSARKWRSGFQRENPQPAVVVRNRQSVDDFQEFDDACKQKRYEGGQFIDFLADKYGWKKEKEDRQNRQTEEEET